MRLMQDGMGHEMTTFARRQLWGLSIHMGEEARCLPCTQLLGALELCTVVIECVGSRHATVLMCTRDLTLKFKYQRYDCKTATTFGTRCGNRLSTNDKAVSLRGHTIMDRMQMCQLQKPVMTNGAEVSLPFGGTTHLGKVE